MMRTILKLLFLLCAMLSALSVNAQDTTPTEPFIDTADIDWSPDGSLVLVGLFNDGIRMIDSATGVELLVIPPEQARYVSDVAFNPDGTQFVVAKEGVTIWDVATGQVLHQLSGYRFDALGAVWSQDGEFVAFGGFRPYLWYPKTGQIMFLFEGAAEDTSEVAVSSDNRVLITMSSLIKIWDPFTQSEVFRFENNNMLSISAMWSRDGQRMLFGGLVLSQAGPIPRVRIIDSATGTILKQFEGYDHVLQAKWSPDETEILVTSRTGRVYLTDVANGTTRIITETGSPFTGAAWSPYGGRVAVGTVPRSSPVASKGTTVSAAFATGIQILVPAPSLDRLNAIAALCDASLQPIDSLDALPDLVAQVESLPEGAIPAACRADLLAVADALR